MAKEATQIPDEVFVVYWALLSWEEENGRELFTTFFDYEDSIFLLMEVGKALKIAGPPDRKLNAKDWAKFTLNVFVEFAADYGVNDIKNIILARDRESISEVAVTVLLQDPATWPINNFRIRKQKINELLIDPDLPE